MLTHYNWIVIGSFQEFSQSIDTNNLVEVLKTLIELNFILANRAPELASYYNMESEPRQITAEEVPDLVRAHLSCNTAYNAEYSARGRPCSRGNQHHWYSQQSLHWYQGTTNILKGQKTCFYSNRNYSNTYHCILIANIIHPILLGIPLPQVITQLML